MFDLIQQPSSMMMCFSPLSEMAETARKALLSRVVELTDDRSALIMEVATLQETVSRLEGRMKEKEEELKRCSGLIRNFQCLNLDVIVNIYIFTLCLLYRLRRELEEYQSDDPDVSCCIVFSEVLRNCSFFV